MLSQKSSKPEWKKEEMTVTKMMQLLVSAKLQYPRWDNIVHVKIRVPQCKCIALEYTAFKYMYGSMLIWNTSYNLFSLTGLFIWKAVHSTWPTLPANWGSGASLCSCRWRCEVRPFCRWANRGWAWTERRWPRRVPRPWLWPGCSPAGRWEGAAPWATQPGLRTVSGQDEICEG